MHMLNTLAILIFSLKQAESWKGVVPLVAYKATAGGVRASASRLRPGARMAFGVQAVQTCYVKSKLSLSCNLI